MNTNGSSRTRVSAEDRLFSLVLALVTSPAVGRSRNELFATVYGYAQQYAPGTRQPTLERMFERDKTHIRELGIPLEVIDSPDASGDNKEQRYRISKTLLQIPESIRFTPEEARMLAAAAHSWQETSFRQDARVALQKLAALSRIDGEEIPRVTVEVRTDEPAHEALQRALQQQHTVQFRYTTRGEQPSTLRTVTPLRLLFADGRWHLISFDHEKNDYRTFLLSRIRGEVIPAKIAYDDGLLARADEQVLRLKKLEASQEVILRVAPSSRAERVLLPRGKRGPYADTITLNTLDYRELAHEIVKFGAEVSVVEPLELRHHVTEILQRISDLHRGEKT